MLWMAGAFLALLASYARANEAVRLEPSSDWYIEYAPASCRLKRDFGVTPNRLALALDRFSPGNDFHFMIVGPGVGKYGLAKADKIFLRFAPDEEAQDVTVMPGTAAGFPMLIVQGGLRVVPLSKAEQAYADSRPKHQLIPYDPPVDPKRVAAITSIEIKYGRSQELVLLTGSMAKPLAALQKCAWETVGEWGLDVTQQQQLSRRPIGINLPWIRDRDYPTSMIDQGYQGIISTRLMIDAKGIPSSCHIQQTTRPKEFDDAVCRVLMERAKFLPALDAEGAAVRSFSTVTVWFKIRR